MIRSASLIFDIPSNFEIVTYFVIWLLHHSVAVAELSIFFQFKWSEAAYKPALYDTTNNLSQY